jgi:type IV pilus assembly protein PilE
MIADDKSRVSERKSYSATGFTLIELMIAVAIIAILAAIAYANYRSYVISSRRTAGATCLLERAQFMERYYTANLTYVGAPNPPACEPETAQFYAVSYTSDPTAKSYILQAVPQGSQQEDTECGTLTLNAQGGRGESGSATDISDCW